MKLKDLTQDQVWELCIEMWTWIVAQLIEDPKRHIDVLKQVWLREHGYDVHPVINSSCFFCGYSTDWDGEYDCSNCPARHVDRTFWCFRSEYQYNLRPGAFLAKIKELNVRRLADAV